MTRGKIGWNKPTRSEAIEALEELYAVLPSLECKGLCADSCTVIDASELERQRLRERGIELGPPTDRWTVERLKGLIASGKTPRCPALSPLNTCRVYEVRPLICRVFGMVLDPRTGDGMMCEHGCIPDATITPAELYRVLLQLDELSEQVTGVRREAHG